MKEISGSIGNHTKKFPRRGKYLMFIQHDPRLQEKQKKIRGPFLTSPLAPRGEFHPLG
jgi:hypothetical protein